MFNSESTKLSTFLVDFITGVVEPVVHVHADRIVRTAAAGSGQGSILPSISPCPLHPVSFAGTAIPTVCRLP